jgi:hypothetical protein
VYGFHVDYGNDGLSTFAAVNALDLELVRHLGARTITNEKAAGPRYRAMTSGGSVAPRVGTWLAVTSAIHASATTPRCGRSRLARGRAPPRVARTASASIRI